MSAYKSEFDKILHSLMDIEPGTAVAYAMQVTPEQLDLTDRLGNNFIHLLAGQRRNDVAIALVSHASSDQILKENDAHISPLQIAINSCNTDLVKVMAERLGPEKMVGYRGLCEHYLHIHPEQFFPNALQHYDPVRSSEIAVPAK